MKNLNGLTISSRIAMFSNLAQVGVGVSLWCLDKEGKLLYSTSNRENEFFAVLKMGVDLKVVLETKAQESGNCPTFWSDDMGISWIAETYQEDGVTAGIVILGPVYLSYTSVINTEKKLNKKNISVTWKRQFLNMLKEVPVLSQQVLSQYINMMHYTITLGILGTNGVIYVASEKQKVQEEQDYGDGYINSEQAVAGEQIFLQAITDGNLNYMEIFDKELGYGEGFVSETGDVIRDGKNSVMIFNSLSSRAAIKGGVSSLVAKKIEKDNIKRIENCVTITELSQLNMEILGTYVHMVHEYKMKNGMSTDIIEVCSYIKANLRAHLTLDGISRRFGYTRYYFSRKFTKETGMKVSEYIRQQRLEIAKIELRSTTRNISEISESLQFANRNYFATSFRKYTGMTPVQYRDTYKEKTGTKNTK